MSETVLLEKIKKLPEDSKEELYDFVDQLEKKSKKEQERHGKIERAFGSLKGVFKMSDDFDEPLEDFKEYM